ncbi:MAG: hypothetical protein H7322_07470 [Ramlibacter sp.]|nr:hypothetical protein [Ramlibacter sp.]
MLNGISNDAHFKLNIFEFMTVSFVLDDLSLSLGWHNEYGCRTPPLDEKGVPPGECDVSTPCPPRCGHARTSRGAQPTRISTAAANKPPTIQGRLSVYATQITVSALPGTPPSRCGGMLP